MTRRQLLLTAAGASTLLAARRPLADTPLLFPDGKKIVPRTLFQGRVMLILMISTECEHCGATVLWLSRVQNDLGPRGLQVIGIAFDEKAKFMLGNFSMRYRPTFPLGYMSLDDGLMYADILKKGQKLSDIKAPTVPILMFVDRRGIVRFEYQGNDKALFGEKPEQTTRLIATGLLREGMPGVPPTQTKTMPAPAKK